jgi:hypothetical protein
MKISKAAEDQLREVREAIERSRDRHRQLIDAQGAYAESCHRVELELRKLAELAEPDAAPVAAPR